MSCLSCLLEGLSSIWLNRFFSDSLTFLAFIKYLKTRNTFLKTGKSTEYQTWKRQRNCVFWVVYYLRIFILIIQLIAKTQPKLLNNSLSGYLVEQIVTFRCFVMVTIFSQTVGRCCFIWSRWWKIFTIYRRGTQFLIKTTSVPLELLPCLILDWRKVFVGWGIYNRNVGCSNSGQGEDNNSKDEFLKG